MKHCAGASHAINIFLMWIEKASLSGRHVGAFVAIILCQARRELARLNYYLTLFGAEEALGIKREPDMSASSKDSQEMMADEFSAFDELNED